MKHWPTLFTFLLLMGCGARDTTGVTAAPPAPVVAEPATGSTFTIENPTLTDDDQKEKRKGNPRRIYQLDAIEKAEIIVGKHKLTVWVMDTMSKRQEGMMWLTEDEVGQDEGMLFVFPQIADLSFWMSNTLLPLDIAFISPERVILNIEHGKPQDESPLPSKGKAKYVLEMKHGAMKRLGIKAGMPVEIPDNVTAKN